MRYLLDTHVFKWLDSEPDKLSTTVARLISDRRNQLVLSFVSIWEIQIKTQIGKMGLRSQLMTIVEDQQRVNQLELLPISLEHILALESLPLYHRDPFDRILISQAVSEDLVLISHDAVFSQYPVQLIW
ncbi:MAG: type II toxin-antitoxin system VapC family toxin [Chloroflexi bacterium]|nr:type II toxin-antitoxin system VapC family toxin [Chloroflexota bacterium]MCC6895962.1 type II toxin-antitoxin system VapC family toxin [Anaerolineae bacterium]